MNYLVVFADQMHKYAFGKENPQVITPSLDRLCDEGVRFTSAYSNNPICSPFRGCLITGQYASVCGCMGNSVNSVVPEDFPSIARTLSAAGYVTGFSGKWHLGGKGNVPIPRYLQAGFDYFDAYQCYNGFYNEQVFYNQNEQERYFAGGHRSESEAACCMEQLRKMAASGKPFCEILSMQAPHYPEQPPEQYYELYKNTIFKLPPDYIETEPYTQTFSPPSPKPKECDPDFHRYGGDMQEYMRCYYAMVTHIDEQMGKIIDLLKELRVYDDTLIIFTADHGDMQGSHGKTNKSLPYERSCGIPFIVRGPGGAAGTVCDTPVSGVDIYATFAAMAGITMPPHLQGVDISDLFYGRQIENPRPVYAESGGTMTIKTRLPGGEEIEREMSRWRMLRQGDYKLTVDTNTGEPLLLYNLAKDPFEMDNLVNLPEIAGLQEQMATRLSAMPGEFAGDFSRK